MHCIRFESGAAHADGTILSEKLNMAARPAPKSSALFEEFAIANSEALDARGYRSINESNTGIFIQAAPRGRYRITALLPLLLRFARTEDRRPNAERCWIPCVCG